MPVRRPRPCRRARSGASNWRRRATARPPPGSISGCPRPACAPQNNRAPATGIAEAPITKTLRLLRRVSRHTGFDDLVGILDRLAALDLVDVLHALGDLAPPRVLAVEEGRVVEADEELAVAGIRAGGARHRGGAADMRLLVELGLQLLAGTARAGAVRATGLRHEAVDHAMEHDAVVKPLAHQFLDPRDVVR